MSRATARHDIRGTHYTGARGLQERGHQGDEEDVSARGQGIAN